MSSSPDDTMERQALRDGAPYVLGVDEVGRGPLAGPVTVAAVAYTPATVLPPALQDSKQLTARRRGALCRAVLEQAVWALGSATAAEIDEHGLAQALHLAGTRAVAEVERRLGPAGAVLLDGPHDFLRRPGRVTPVVKGDSRCLSIAAASVVAKVARDNWMDMISTYHPHYGWDSNKGYGTAAHLRAIEQHGVSWQHRLSWRTLAGRGLTRPAAASIDRTVPQLPAALLEQARPL